LKGKINKYFIALIPPEPLLTQVRKMKEEVFALVASKGALRSPAHITLHMPFEWSENKEQKLIQTLSEYCFNSNEIKIKLNGFNVFEPRVIFIDVNSNELLNHLEKELSVFMAMQLNLFNQRDSLRAFHPHITIAFRDLNKNKFYSAWEKFKHQEMKSEFSATSFCLLKSDGDQWKIHHEFKFKVKTEQMK